MRGLYKEIERLKTKQKLTFMHSKEDYFQRCNLLEEANIKLQFNQTKLAIQELEKIKNKINNLFIYSWKGESEIGDELISNEEVLRVIDQQIKELKGEKDE